MHENDLNHTSPTYSPMITIGPRVRKSPYFDATMRWGAKAFTVYNHMYMPTHYGDPVSEYWSLVRDVTLWDVSCQRQIIIRGPDYVILTDSDGGVINDAVLMHMRENEFWLSPGDGDVVLWAQGVASRTDLDVEVIEGDICPLQLQGPKSPHVAYRLFGQAALEMGYFHVIETELNGLKLAVSRTGWSGELGYELYLKDHIHGNELWDTVMAAGEEFNIAPAAPNTIRSIEGCLLSYFSDIRRLDNPYTFGLGRLVNLDKKAEFLGREALRKIHANGNIRRLVGIEIEGEAITHNESFWHLVEDGERIGHVSRCVWSPRLERNIGLANVPAERTEPGSSLTVVSPEGPRNAVVVKTPWFESEKVIPPIDLKA
jgi:aminomethyltransferase